MKITVDYRTYLGSSSRLWRTMIFDETVASAFVYAGSYEAAIGVALQHFADGQPEFLCRVATECEITYTDAARAEIQRREEADRPLVESMGKVIQTWEVEKVLRKHVLNGPWSRRYWYHGRWERRCITTVEPGDYLARMPNIQEVWEPGTYRRMMGD